MLFFCAPTGVRADDASADAAHNRRAKQFFELGKFSEAARSYGLAYQANPRAKYLYNIGVCHLKLGTLEQLVRAETNFKACQRKATGRLRAAAAMQLARVQKLMLKLRARSASPPVSAPTRPRDPGQVPGPAPLKPSPATPPKPDTTVAPRPHTTPVTPDPARPGGRLPVWTLVTAGAAVALVGAGLGLGLWASSGWDEYNETTDEDRYDELRDAVPVRSTAANICYGLAGAMAVTSALVYLLVERKKKTERPSPATVSVGPGGATLRLEF